jgi:hypothetical protein
MKLLLVGTKPTEEGKNKILLDKMRELGYDVEYRMLGDEYEGCKITYAVLDEFSVFELEGEKK